jgi:16S rRNA (uracil1498-N3)-methyltransferase
MDTVVEKAAELGAAAIQPLLTERSVLRLSGERAQRKRDHWQAVAIAACEQCGRATVPRVGPLLALPIWLAALPFDAGARWLLSPRAGAPGLGPEAMAAVARSGSLVSLSGPEGGLSADECAVVAAAGFHSVNLGPRVLRADTAPLALMAWLSLQA